ncbi:extracellular solute-binding protein [Streptomyces sp. JNUCC 64]
MLTTLLNGCGTGGEEPDGDTTLTLVAADYGDSPGNGSAEYWDDLVVDFRKDNPDIDVEVTVLPWTEIDARVKDMVAEGEAPDMAQIGAYSDYAADGALYSADDLLSVVVQADFLPVLADAGQLDRVQYGLPFAASTRLLFYNKALFRKAGITDPPRTWKELKAAAVRLRQEGVDYPFALPLGPEEAQGETLTWLLSGGHDYTDGKGAYDFDDPANVRTLTWLRDELVREGLTGPTPPSRLNRAAAFSAFAEGDVGMLNGHPTLMRISEAKDVEYGMVRMPGPAEESLSSLGVVDWLMAFRENGHQEEIGRFLDHVYRKENVLAFSRRYDMLPVTHTAAEEMSKHRDDKELLDFLDRLQAARLYPVDKTSWPQVSADIKQRIGAAVDDGGDPERVLRTIQRRALRAAEDRPGG